jgi:two-component system response regulator FixJ
MPTSAPTVYVVDDEATVQESVAALVGSHGVRAKVFDSAEQFLANYDRNSAGCLITDQRMLGLSGTELLRILNSEGGHLPVILITAYATVPLAVRAMELGAVTVLEKPCREQELWQSIEQALELDSRVYATRIRAHDLRQRIASLLAEERAVLDRIVAGQQNKTIAHELGIGLRTVEARRQAIFSKMRASSLAELLRFVLDAKTPACEHESCARLAADDASEE